MGMGGCTGVEARTLFEGWRLSANRIRPTMHRQRTADAGLCSRGVTSRSADRGGCKSEKISKNVINTRESFFSTNDELNTHCVFLCVTGKMTTMSCYDVRQHNTRRFAPNVGAVV